MRYLANWWLGILLVIFLAGCGRAIGYQRKGDSFVFVDWGMELGYQEHPIQGIDPKTFQVLTSNGFARDKQRAYSTWFQIPGADVSSFVVISKFYAKDSTRVYFGHYVVEQADVNSFVVLSDTYARDSRRVYYLYRVIEQADISSFVVLSDGRAKDKNRCYLAEHVFRC